MSKFMDWVYIIINVQTLWTNLIITFFTHINNYYNQRMINYAHTYLVENLQY